MRFFRFADGSRTLYDSKNGVLETFVTYMCGNCRRRLKIFSLRAEIDPKDRTSGTCYKFGEQPPYGPQTPARLLRLFGDDREIFLKGRRCENQGLGIGAFAYYRRMVEKHKDAIIEEILRVAKQIAAPKEMTDALEKAKTEVQFSKAVETVKNAIPQSLLINGQNPLTLLHRALSVGLHDQSDEKCLELAHDVRVVLAELAERAGQALKDEAELTTAVSRLMKSRN